MKFRDFTENNLCIYMNFHISSHWAKKISKYCSSCVFSWHISYCPQEKGGIKEIWSLTVNHLPATPYMTWWGRDKNVCSASKQRRVNINSELLEEEIRRVSHSSGCPWIMRTSLPSTTTGKGGFWTRQVASWLQNRTTEVVSLTSWRREGRKWVSFPSLVSLQALVWLSVIKTGSAH